MAATIARFIAWRWAGVGSGQVGQVFRHKKQGEGAGFSLTKDRIAQKG